MVDAMLKGEMEKAKEINIRLFSLKNVYIR